MHAFGNLKVVTTTDEDDNVREVFSDMDDKVILERRKDEGQNNDTYYVYDIRDSLVCVIQPMGAKSHPASFSFDSQFAQNWCFTYIYDAVGNLIEKSIYHPLKEIIRRLLCRSDKNCSIFRRTVLK